MRWKRVVEFSPTRCPSNQRKSASAVCEDLGGLSRPEDRNFDRNQQKPSTLRNNMASYQPAPILKPPPPAATQRTPESRHWRRYRQPTYVKSFAPITHVHFAPSRPHRLAVTAGAEVKLHAPRTNKVVKTVTRFKETARGGEIRKDGNLLVAGDDSGLVQVRSLVCSRPLFAREWRADVVWSFLRRCSISTREKSSSRFAYTSSAYLFSLERGQTRPRLLSDPPLVLGLRTRLRGPLTLLLSSFPLPMTLLSRCTTSRPRRQ